MTSLVAWTGIDSRGPASLYCASDSRISWGVKGWNDGRKLFAARNGPHLLGYVGDVLFPSLFLGQAVELIEGRMLFASGASHADRVDALHRLTTEAFVGYPEDQRQDFSIIYGSREGDGMASTFHVSRIDWSKARGFSSTHLKLPEHSGPVVVLGSGKSSVEKWHARWNATHEQRTSRAVFSAFCDSLAAGEDPLTGGPPQLVACYRKGTARVIGTAYRGRAYRLGLPAGAFGGDESEWRNELFERCDRNGMLLPSAQQHRRPKGLGKAHLHF
jgi:hypothetical protein